MGAVSAPHRVNKMTTTPNRSKNREWSKIAIGSQLTMLIYFTIDNHVYLYPWNNLESLTEQIPSTLWGPFLLIMLAFRRRVRWGMALGTIWTHVWLALQFQQWWVPYLFGRADTSWYVNGGYDETLKLLPSLGTGVIPDAQHNVLQLLSLIVIITTYMAFFEDEENPKD